MPGKLTIREVAREAGVGVGTVSRVLNKSPHVSSDTRRRVLAAMERLGFRPSRIAQGLVRGRTQTLGVLVPFFTKHYFLEILRGIEQAVSASDYSLIVYNVERPGQAATHLDFLTKIRRVDGLIIIALSAGAMAQGRDEVTLSLPVAGVDTEIEGAINLLPDHETGMYLAVNHLTALGHRQIALIDRPQDPVSGTRTGARRLGYRRACREAGLVTPRSYVVTAEYSQEGGYRTARRLLARSQPPTAFACGSDLQAIGVLRAIAEAGLRAGRDVGVTGYHDVELAQYVGLTTVRLPAFEMGKTAATLLVALLAGQPQDSQVIWFSPELVVRETCGAPRQVTPR